MFTTCPKCALNLAITAADLRIGQGYVRCGRCANVFNALVGLADESEPATVEPATDESEPGSGSEILVETSMAEGDPGTGTFETIILEGDAVTQTTEVVGEAEVDEQLLALAQQIKAANAEVDGIPLEDSDEVEVLELRDRALPAGLSPEEPSRPFTQLFAPQAAPAQSDALVDFGDLSDEASARARLLRTLCLLGCVLLALLLLVQLVHHYRTRLATGPLATPLAVIYGAFGLSLQPAWDLGAYELRQLGATASSAVKEQILLRASVRNTATRAQPLPVLRVTLRDRFGNPIGRRDVAPPDYVRASTGGHLAPDQRVDADILMRDPAQNAVGFEIDVCLPGDGGALACAEDRPKR